MFLAKVLSQRARSLAVAVCVSGAIVGCGRNGGVGESPDAGAEPGPRPADAGVCNQPHCPETLYDRSQFGGPRRGVDVDDTDIFWCELTAAEGNVVRAAPKDGSGPVRTLGGWTDFGASASLVADSQHVYWLFNDGSTTSLMRGAKAGGEPTSLVLPDAVPTLDPGPLLDAGDSVVIAEHGCGRVVRVPKDGAASTIWRASQYPPSGGVTGLELRDQVVYCGNGQRIFALDTQSEAITEFVAGQDLVGPLMLDAGNLYFINNRGDSTNRAGDLGALSLDSGTARELGDAYGNASRLLLDRPRRTIHWLVGRSATEARLAVYHLEGAGPPDVVLEGQNLAGDSASDTDYLYWLSEHAVTRLKKWP